MTRIASGWEARRAMIRVCGAVVLCFVTAIAIFRGVCVVAVLMTGGARLLGVHAGEWEELVVIKTGLVPVRVRVFMTGIAGGWETGGAMIWICGAVVLCFMATVAIFWRVCVVAVLMTGLAGLLGMNTRKREELIVVKLGSVPVWI